MALAINITAPGEHRPLREAARRLLLLFGLVTPALLRAVFVDKAPGAGVDLNYPLTVEQHTDLALDPYSSGGASCACDIDGDGWTDLIVTRTRAPCLVFINQHDGTFREEAAARGLAGVSDIGGIGAGDLTNKGSVDIFMTPASGARYYLFINDGTGHFQEVAAGRGADVPVSVEPHKGQTVTMVDYDRDGYLDIYVSEWGVANTAENAKHSVLLHNKGAAAPGQFENQTAAAGLVQPLGVSTSLGFTGLWTDLDGDGYPDLALVADTGASQLYWNNGDGTFSNGTKSSGFVNSVAAMGAAVLDYDGDGKLDIFISGITLDFMTGTQGYTPKNLLYRNLGNRQLQEVAATANVEQSGWGWGAESLDANNDGWPDLFVTNGFQAINAAQATALTDPSTLFINHNGAFSDLTAVNGITDTGLGRSVAVLDYDNDGREDIFITQTVGHRILYHNENSTANAHWLALRFSGTASNRDGYGCEVTVTAGGRNQVAIYNPTNTYLGQREPRLHFGLGAGATVDRIRIKWPSGTVQELSTVAADQLLLVTEPGSSGSGTPAVTAPLFTAEPRNTSAPKDGSLTLSVAAQGSPAPVFNWFKDGVRIPGETGATLTRARVQPIDAGTYTATATNQNGTVTSRAATVTVTADLAAKSVARWWNEALLDGIRKDTPNPPVHARNLFHLSAALWDSFWAYERDGWATQDELFRKETITLPATEADRLAAQREAMSYAAYTLLQARFVRSPGAAATTAGFRWLMQQYGFNPDATDTTGNSPSAVGLRIGQQVLERNLGDGANEANGYVDATGYKAANPPLVVRNPGVGAGVDPDHWQPLDLANTITQNGIVLGTAAQNFVGSNAKATRTFALRRRTDGFLVDDPGGPPRFNGSNKPEYLSQARQVVAYSAQLTTADSVTIDISPGKILNNPLATNDGHGHEKNPVTGRAYDSNVVLQGDYGRVLAEFWADGPNSETPPGHWNVLFNEVSDHPLTEHKFMGRGPVLRRLEWDVAGYLVLNGALHDAASAAWTLKWEYDSARPITMIRYLASRGQSSDPAQPGYSPDGLPLEPGLIEVITAASAAPGQRHAHLAASIGQIAVRSWLGTPPSATQTSGVGWILGVNWVPYQRETFVTPAFPGYISGHSTFSRAAAEVLTLFTGSEYFPGGLATHDFPAGKGLGFEAGPAKDVQLQWATYADAADQAGLSRLYGGIHIPADDFTGRSMGALAGLDAFEFFVELYTPPKDSAAAPPAPASPGTPASPVPAAPAASSGGGGAPSVGFYVLLLLLVAARALSRRQLSSC